jgi:hypothetical protein
VDRSCWQVIPTKKGRYCVSSHPSEVNSRQMKRKYRLHGRNEASVA